MVIDDETIEIDLTDLHEMYQPHGLCAYCLTHQATEMWLLYGGGTRRYEYRCHCCVVKGKLERAKAYAERIPHLEVALHRAKENCQ